MMGVFGMLAVAVIVFGLRQVSSDQTWRSAEKYVRVSFWGLNAGLLGMVILNLFPAGILQLQDVLRNGYWHGRSPLFTAQPLMRFIEWLRMPADLVFIGAGIIPLVLAALVVYRQSWSTESTREAAPAATGLSESRAD
jgi:nitric oxide reductase subunit B